VNDAIRNGNDDQIGGGKRVSDRDGIAADHLGGSDCGDGAASRNRHHPVAGPARREGDCGAGPSGADEGDTHEAPILLGYRSGAEG
jgi:hypothetical protein